MKKSILISVFCALVLLTGIAAAQTQYAASDALGSAQNAISFMESKGFSTVRANDLLQDAKFSFSQSDYERSMQASNEVVKLKEKAVLLDEKIILSKGLLEVGGQIGINTSLLKGGLESGIADFKSDNYETAEQGIDFVLSSLNSQIKAEISGLLETLKKIQEKSSENGIRLNSASDLLDQINNINSSSQYAYLGQAKSEAINLDSSLNKLIESKKSIEEISLQGLGTQRMDDLFREAVVSLELKNFEKADLMSSEIVLLKSKILDINSQTVSAKDSISAAKLEGIETAKPEQMLAESEKLFGIGNYEDAEKYLKDSVKALEDAKSSRLVFGVISKESLKFNLAEFFKGHWDVILLSSAALSAIAYFAFGAIRSRLLKSKISRLKSEEATINELIKKAQENYFNKKTISKEAYETITDNYRERIITIREKLPVLESRIDIVGRQDKKY